MGCHQDLCLSLGSGETGAGQVSGGGKKERPDRPRTGAEFMSCGPEVKNGSGCGNSPYLLRLHSDPQGCTKDYFNLKIFDIQQVQKETFWELPLSD